MTTNLPLNYQNMLSLLLVSNIPGVFSKFYRHNVYVPAGGSTNLTVTMPSDEKANVVYVQTLSADQYTNNLTVSMQVDSNDPTLENIPLSDKIPLEGTFLPAVNHQIVYTLDNANTTGINFYADTQMIIFTSNQYLAVYEPLRQRQTEALMQLIGGR